MRGLFDSVCKVALQGFAVPKSFPFRFDGLSKLQSSFKTFRGVRERLVLFYPFLRNVHLTPANSDTLDCALVILDVIGMGRKLAASIHPLYAKNALVAAVALGLHVNMVSIVTSLASANHSVKLCEVACEAVILGHCLALSLSQPYVN